MLAVALALVAPAHAAARPYIVSLKQPVSDSKARELAHALGGELIQNLQQLNRITVRIDAARASLRSLANAHKSVTGIEPARKLRLAWTPNDPHFSAQWGLAAINATSGWDSSRGWSDTVIAIIDSGVDYTHPDLVGKVVLGPDYGNGDNDPRDTNGHGTHVAAIAAARANDGYGVAGVCPNCSLLAVKVLPDWQDSTWDSYVAAGVVWAADNGADVINLSLGSPRASSVLADAIRYASAHGVVIVAAAGNTGDATVSYPAALPEVIAVAAAASRDSIASFSSTGRWVEVAAPGLDILSSIPDAGFAYFSGTSMATPFVAGLAGILKGEPGATAASVRARIGATATDVGIPGRDVSAGYGLIDLDAALAAASGGGSGDDDGANRSLTLPARMPTAPVGLEYEARLNAAGGCAPYFYDAITDLPDGFELSRDGVLGGIAHSPGTSWLEIRVGDACGNYLVKRVLLVFALEDITSRIVSLKRSSGVLSATIKVSRRRVGQDTYVSIALVAGGRMSNGLALIPAGGKSGTAVLTVGQLSRGGLATVTVDPDDVIRESNERNNRARRRYR